MEPGFLPGSDAEWTGLFLFGVGVFGAYHHATLRHLALWGVIPAGWFYFGHLVVGAGLLFACSPLAPWAGQANLANMPDADRLPGQMVRVSRSLTALLLLGAVVWVAFRH